jgi:hypothetical protein
VRVRYVSTAEWEGSPVGTKSVLVDRQKIIEEGCWRALLKVMHCMAERFKDQL